MRFVVVSTCIDQPGQGCIESVQGQGVDATHIVIVSSPHVTQLENWYRAISAASVDDVVVLLDGDDRLHVDALKRVAAEYDAGAWVTYGQFRGGFARPPALADRDLGDRWVRDGSVCPTHLRTFRAVVAKSVPLHYLLDDEGNFWAGASDVAMMTPVLELAGWDRCTFIPDELVEYTTGRWSAEREANEKKYSDAIRALPPLKALP